MGMIYAELRGGPRDGETITVSAESYGPPMGVQVSETRYEAAPQLDNVEWSIVWRDANNTDLRTDHIEMPRALDWTEATQAFTAPAGATHVAWNWQWADEMAGAAIQIDDLAVHTN